MLQSLTKFGSTRPAAASLALIPPLSTAHVLKRFYATGKNEHLLKFLRECENEEASSPTRNKYKIRSFRMAAAAIEKLDFRVKNGDELKGVGCIGDGIRNRINALLDHEPQLANRRASRELSKLKVQSTNQRASQEPSEPNPPASSEELRKEMAVRTFLTIPGIGRMGAEALYDNGCDTVARLHLKKYKETLTPESKKCLKYFEHIQRPLPRENAETLVAFCKQFLQTDEIIIAGKFRRDAPTPSEAIELLIVNNNADNPIPTPPHPSTLEPPRLRKSPRIGRPFLQYYLKKEAKATSALLNNIIQPLESVGVVADTLTPGVNLWQGWVRVPKRGDSWESRKERLEGVRSLNGDFHRVNITYAPRKSRGAALLALTGDGDFYPDCKRKAFQAGLYLNEWGLWEWEPDPQSLSRFQTSDAPHAKTSLGAIWGSETEEDEGRWIQLDAVEEEQIFEHIGAEYVPPERRNLRLIMEKTRPKKVLQPSSRYPPLLSA